MNTTLDPQFLAACLLLSNFKGAAMVQTQGALLHLALRGREFTAAEVPGEITGGSKHIAGAATGALVALQLIQCVGRVKSPRPEAKGRKLDVWRLALGRKSTAEAWLRANNLPLPQSNVQLDLIAQ